MTDADELRAWSYKYPPVAQKRTELSAIDIEIRSAGGSVRLDPNTAIIEAHSEDLPLGEPYLTSILSGEPGYLFRNDVVEIPLTAAEIYRLFRRNLRPEEFLRLAEKVGVFYEISGQYYDEGTGIATDPVYSYAEQEERNERSERPHLFVMDDLQDNPRPHSIMEFEVASALRREYASQAGLRSYVVSIDGPHKSWLPNPFDNIVALHISAGSEMRAHGPFKTTEEAFDYRPANGEPGWAQRIVVGSVNSTFAP